MAQLSIQISVLTKIIEDVETTLDHSRASSTAVRADIRQKIRALEQLIEIGKAMEATHISVTDKDFIELGLYD